MFKLLVLLFAINEVSFLEKEHFYSYLNMEYITDADHVHPKRICKDFKIWNLGDFPYLET